MVFKKKMLLSGTFIVMMMMIVLFPINTLASCSSTAVGTVVLNNCPLYEYDLGVNSTLT